VFDVPGVIESFHVNETLAISPVAIFSFGVAIGCLIHTAVCEVFGRTIVYKVGLPLTVVFTIVGGTAKNFATMGTARALAGLFFSPTLTCGIGILNDIWDVRADKLGTLFVVLYAMNIVWSAPIGAMVSGSLISHHSWRWSFGVITIMVRAAAVPAFFLSETYEPEVLRNRAKKMKLPIPPRGKSLAVFLVSIDRPFHMMFVEPLVFPSGLVLAVLNAILYSYYVAYTLLFQEAYHFTPSRFRGCSSNGVPI
jgi:MFS family permease